MLFEELLELETGWSRITILGIEELGVNIINELLKYNIKNLEYLALSYSSTVLDYCKCLDKLLLDDFDAIVNKVYDQDVIIIVGEANDSKYYDLMIKLANLSKDNKVFNLAFLNGYLVDSNLIDNISNCKFSSFINYDTKLIEKTIAYIVGSIYLPGLICMDIVDVSMIFGKDKQTFCYYIEGDDPENMVDNLISDISKDFNFNCIKNCFVSIDGGLDIRLKTIDDILSKIRSNISNEGNICYASQLLNNGKNKYAISFTYTINI